MKTSQRDSTPLSLKADEIKFPALETQSPHIHIHPGNTLGKDRIQGDVHGSLIELEAVLCKMGEHDRLFLVGDLNDKGPFSQKVIERIIEFNQKHGQRIFVTCGNHEKAAIELYDALRKKPEAKKTYEEAKATSLALNQEWLIALAESTDPEDQQALDKIIAYCKTLPYIILTEGTDRVQPFLMVHSDLPFEHQQELFDNLKQILTEEQITHCIWARRKDSEHLYKKKTAALENLIVYCGHSILEGIRLAGFYINLDIGTYYNQAFLVVNHTDSCVETSSKGVFDATDKQKVSNLIYQIPILLKLVETFHAQSVMHERIVDEEYESDPSNPENSLLAKKAEVLFEILNTLKETVGDTFNADLTKNPQPSDLARNIKKVIIKNIKTVLEEFKSADYHEFDADLQQVIACYIANGDYRYLEYSEYQIWVYSQDENKIHQLDLHNLPFEQTAAIIKQLLINTPPENWFKFGYLSRLFKDATELNKFIMYCAEGTDKISLPALFIHFFSALRTDPQLTFREKKVIYYSVEPKFSLGYFLTADGNIFDLEKVSRHAAFLAIRNLLLTTPPREWIEINSQVKNYIKTEQMMHEFLVFCNNRINFDDMYEFFFQETQKKLLVTVSNPQSIANQISRLPQDENRHKNINDILFGYQYLKPISEETKKINLYLAILNQLIEHREESPVIARINTLLALFKHEQSSLSKQFTEIFYKKFIFLLEDTKPEKRESEFKLFLIDMLLQTRNLTDGNLQRVLRTFLKSEYEIAFPDKVKGTISTLSFLPPDTDYKKLYQNLQSGLQKILPEAKYNLNSSPDTQETAKRNFNDLTEIVLMWLQQFKAAPNARFFSKTTNGNIVTKLQILLETNHILVPKAAATGTIRHITDMNKLTISATASPEVT